MRLRLMMMLRGFLARERQREERIVGACAAAELAHAVGEIAGMPERLFGVLRESLQTHHVPALQRDHAPRQHRHHRERDGNTTRHEIPLRPDVGDTVVLHFDPLVLRAGVGKSGFSRAG
jgi:DNA repair photolyase